MSKCEIYSSDSSCDNNIVNNISNCICTLYAHFNFSKRKGYDHNDWYISVPVLDPSEEPVELSDDLLGQTFEYFILSSERLSQMTKTYNDIGAVTRLLEEVSFQ